MRGHTYPACIAAMLRTIISATGLDQVFAQAALDNPELVVTGGADVVMKMHPARVVEGVDALADVHRPGS